MSDIKLQSFDGVVFVVDMQVAKVSLTLKTMLENCGMVIDEDTIVPLQNIHSSILRKVLKWAAYHKDDPQLREDDEKEQRTDDIPEWDIEFLRMDQSILFELMMAANYLDIKSLITLICKTVANMIKQKHPEQIRKLFNIKNDFTPEEEEIVRREQEWCNKI